ncbi:UDP-glucose dehydrogenase family protein [Noviherbaspirillum malthae]|uniref:UDP-glucose dehydrogenase family protein n=1 Tax=Noviherbaspirillum malthae TaxID=1260987 RepID=UPI00188DDDC9|nr:UDP-glucose/GDP-mannose dehydrogenase family protein [Noviherbaspirillum malthae]
MNVTIIGTGYVGLVTGACLAELGNHVLCLDVDLKKIDFLNEGGIPIYEPGLEEIVCRNREAGRLMFSTDTAAAVAYSEIQFIAVGTPSDEDGSADLTYVLEAADNIGMHMTGFKIIICKSTVPVGTAEKVREAIQIRLNARNKNIAFSVVSNPEFLKEGAAIEDFMRPDRIIVGVDTSDEGQRAQTAVKALYAPFNRHHARTIWMDVRSAEFTKYAANAMLATRISFMNELANLADKVNVDVEAVRQGIGSDPRIGFSFLYAGCGYGGSCFPKDVKALGRTAEERGEKLLLLHAVDEVNTRQKYQLSNKIIRRFGSDLRGMRFAVWGLAFKPNTDDMREAPSRILIAQLTQRGASIMAYDPVSMVEARHVLQQDMAHMPEVLSRIHFCREPMEALDGADALVLVTEWKIFRSPDFGQIKTRLRNAVIFDGRNLYDPVTMATNGIEYYGIGRTSAQVAVNHPHDFF